MKTEWFRNKCTLCVNTIIHSIHLLTNIHIYNRCGKAKNVFIRSFFGWLKGKKAFILRFSSNIFNMLIYLTEAEYVSNEFACLAVDFEKKNFLFVCILFLAMECNNKKKTTKTSINELSET